MNRKITKYEISNNEMKEGVIDAGSEVRRRAGFLRQPIRPFGVPQNRRLLLLFHYPLFIRCRKFFASTVIAEFGIFLSPACTMALAWSFFPASSSDWASFKMFAMSSISTLT